MIVLKQHGSSDGTGTYLTNIILALVILPGIIAAFYGVVLENI
jgi:uncharacterized membrane protein YqaE (UPF0057 family)